MANLIVRNVDEAIVRAFFSELLEQGLQQLLQHFSQHILAFDHHCAQVWGRLQVLNQDAIIDKQIAGTGARVLSPFD